MESSEDARCQQGGQSSTDGQQDERQKTRAGYNAGVSSFQTRIGGECNVLVGSRTVNARWIDRQHGRKLGGIGSQADSDFVITNLVPNGQRNLERPAQ